MIGARLLIVACRKALVSSTMLRAIFFKEITMDKRFMKKSKEELVEYLQFRRRGSSVDNKKGKGSYKRNKKHRKNDDGE